MMRTRYGFVYKITSIAQEAHICTFGSNKITGNNPGNRIKHAKDYKQAIYMKCGYVKCMPHLQWRIALRSNMKFKASTGEVSQSLVKE